VGRSTPRLGGGTRGGAVALSHDSGDGLTVSGQGLAGGHEHGLQGACTEI
jgi:hypothetical protein